MMKSSDGSAPCTTSVPEQWTPRRAALSDAQVHAARNSLYAIQVATYSLAELASDQEPADRRRLRQSIEREINHVRNLLDL